MSCSLVARRVQRLAKVASEKRAQLFIHASKREQRLGSSFKHSRASIDFTRHGDVRGTLENRALDRAKRLVHEFVQDDAPYVVRQVRTPVFVCARWLLRRATTLARGRVDVVLFRGFRGFRAWRGALAFRGARHGLKFPRRARDNDVESDHEIFITTRCGLGYAVMRRSE